MSELNLLIECLSTEGEAEDGGVKYIYMDENTVYRFENNRMKKISKTLINKARKQIQTQNTIRTIQEQTEDEPKPQPQPKSKKSKKQPVREVEPVIDDVDDDEYDDEEPVKPIKQPKSRSKTSRRTRREFDDMSYSPNINLDEYYNNKNKMEYMNLEITRLNNKVDKLRQYKAIVNKLTGNEFDMDVPSVQKPIVDEQPRNVQGRNDSLFLY